MSFQSFCLRTKIELSGPKKEVVHYCKHKYNSRPVSCISVHRVARCTVLVPVASILCSASLLLDLVSKKILKPFEAIAILLAGHREQARKVVLNNSSLRVSTQGYYQKCTTMKQAALFTLALLRNLQMFRHTL